MKLSKFNFQVTDNKYYLSIFFFISCFFLISEAVRFITIERQAFVVDELVDINIGVRVSNGYRLYSNADDGPYLIRTPLLTYIIGLVVNPLQGSYGASISARKIMWLFSLLIFLLTYTTSRRFKNHFSGILALMLLCCFTTFLERSFRVRTDLLSTLFSMPALVVLSGTFISIPQLVIAGFFLGLAFLTTQKAVYFILSFYAAIVISRIYLSRINYCCFKKLIVECFAVFLGLIIPISIFLIYIFNAGTLSNFLKQCFSHAFHAGFVEKTYSYTWGYLSQSMQQNLIFWILGILGIFIILFENLKSNKNNLLANDKIKTDRNTISIGIWSISLLFFIINHKVKFPYLFINIAPTLAISGSLILARLIDPISLNNKRLRLKLKSFGILILILLIFPSIKWHYEALNKSNILKSQKAIMSRIGIITSTNDAVFDGVGIAVTRNKATPYSLTDRWYNERKAIAKFDIIETLKRTRPKALIKNYRFKRLRDDEIDFLKKHFIYDWANIFVVGKKIIHNGPGETKLVVNLLASTEYAVLSKFRENIFIDGRIPDSVLFLESGDHEIIIRGERQDLFLKYFPAVNKQLPPQNHFDLFPSY